MYSAHRGRRAALLALASLTIHGAGAQDLPTIVMSTGTLWPYTSPERSGFLDLLLGELFARMGRRATVHVYEAASERSMLNANAGLDDGLAMRIDGMEAQYPNLVRVAEPVVANDFVVIARRGARVEPTWESLASVDVAYIIGWKIAEARLAQSGRATRVRDANQLFNLLLADRCDAVIYERWQAQVKTSPLGDTVRTLEPPIATTPMYMYLHQKHAALAPRAAETLVRMKQDGSYARIFNVTLKTAGSRPAP